GGLGVPMSLPDVSVYLGLNAPRLRRLFLRHGWKLRSKGAATRVKWQLAEVPWALEIDRDPTFGEVYAVEGIVGGLRQLAGELRHSPSTTEWVLSRRAPSLGYVLRHFPVWNDAL